MEHFYHFFCPRKKGSSSQKKKDKHLSAISCCLLNITKGPCAQANVPKMWVWVNPAAGPRPPLCCPLFSSFFFFLLPWSAHISPFEPNQTHPPFIPFSVPKRDNNINAGNLNGRAQWMKFANIFQKLNFSGKFFLQWWWRAEGGWLAGRKKDTGMGMGIREKGTAPGFMKISEENWFEVLWSAKTRSQNHWRMLWHIISTFFRQRNQLCFSLF